MPETKIEHQIRLATSRLDSIDSSDDLAVVKDGSFAMFNKPPLKHQKGSSTDWNNWISVSAIAVLITLVIVIELHIRGLINHPVLQK
jgi:hypothetical protein